MQRVIMGILKINVTYKSIIGDWYYPSSRYCKRLQTQRLYGFIYVFNGYHTVDTGQLCTMYAIKLPDVDNIRKY